MNTPILIIAFAGHILCGVTDCLLSYGKNGKRLDFKSISDPEKMRAGLKDASAEFALVSMLLGVFAITMFSFGYFEIVRWTGQFSDTFKIILYISAIVCLIPMTAHHVFCGTVIWFYVKLGHTDEARNAVLTFLKQTSPAMIAGYIGMLFFSGALFIAVLTGVTPFPRWACVFNAIPAMLLLAPTKLPAKANIACAVMFLGLAVMSIIAA